MNTILTKDITKITNTSNQYAHGLKFWLTLHTKDLDIKITQLYSVEYMRDYAANSSDYVIVKFRLPAGTFVYDVYPNRDHMELTIQYGNMKKLLSTVRYKFVMLNNNGGIEGTRHSYMPRNLLDKAELIVVEGQCLLREAEGLRTSYLSGVYSRATLQDTLKTEIKNTAAKVKLEGQPIDIEVSVADLANTKVYDHIVIPTGTRLLQVGNVLQNNEYGLYNGKVGTYLQHFEDKLTYFLYPLYDNERFSKAKKKLMIYADDNQKYVYQENTWIQDAGIVSIIGNNKTKIQDNGENDFNSEGSGVINNNPDVISNRDVTVTDDEAKSSKENHMAGSKITEKRDGTTNSVYLGNQSNSYKFRSDISQASMATMQVVWNYAVPDRLFPGMPVCYIYADGKEKSGSVVRLNGTLLGVYVKYDNAPKTMSALLNIAVEKPLIKRYSKDSSGGGGSSASSKLGSLLGKFK